MDCRSEPYSHDASSISVSGRKTATANDDEKLRELEHVLKLLAKNGRVAQALREWNPGCRDMTMIEALRSLTSEERERVCRVMLRFVVRDRGITWATQEARVIFEQIASCREPSDI